MKKSIIYLLFFCLCLGNILAQDTIEQAEEKAVFIVTLKSGSVIECTINDWQINETIDIKTDWDDSLILPQDQIKHVVQKSSLTGLYTFDEQGIYYSLKTQFITGNDGNRARHINGLGFSAVVGHRFHRLLGIGIGVGYDKFVWDTGENLMPLFVEYTGYLSPSNSSLFLNVQAGYSMVIKDEDFQIIEAQGGTMLYPAIGLRFGKGPTKMTLDAGYKFQKARFKFRDAWSTDTHDQRLTYKRLTLRFGILI